MSEVISPPALAYARAVVSHVKLEMMSGAIPDGKARIIVLFPEPVVKKVAGWMNRAITLEAGEIDHVTESQCYKFLAVAYISHYGTWVAQRHDTALLKGRYSRPGLH